LLHEIVGIDQQNQDSQEDKEKAPRFATGRSLKPVPDLNGENATAVAQKPEADKRAYMTTLASSKSAKEAVSFRTVPVWLKANGQKIKVNAVLDDASSASYISEGSGGSWFIGALRACHSSSFK
jgi:hypothetical protein